MSERKIKTARVARDLMRRRLQRKRD